MGLDAVILAFLMLSFKPAFSFSSFHLPQTALVPLYFLPLRWYHLHWVFKIKFVLSMLSLQNDNPLV